MDEDKGKEFSTDTPSEVFNQPRKNLFARKSEVSDNEGSDKEEKPKKRVKKHSSSEKGKKRLKSEHKVVDLEKPINDDTLKKETTANNKVSLSELPNLNIKSGRGTPRKMVKAVISCTIDTTNQNISISSTGAWSDVTPAMHRRMCAIMNTSLETQMLDIKSE